MTATTMARRHWRSLPGPVRKAAVALGGASVLSAGAAMLVLPGPGIAVILVGLAILGTEFAWARTVLGHARRRWHHVRARVPRLRGQRTSAPADQPDPTPHHITRGS